MYNLNKVLRLSHLRSGLMNLAGMVVEVIEELDGAKLDKPEIAEAAIPATGWSSDSTAGYPYYYDLTVEDVTAADTANVNFAPASIRTAIACGLCPASETIAGAIRIRAAEIPEEAMAVEYEIVRGKEGE